MEGREHLNRDPREPLREIIVRYLSYQDAPLEKEDAKRTLEGTLEMERATTYANALNELLGEKREEVETLAADMVDECQGILLRLGVASSPFGFSKSWAFWDIAKQQHYASLPEDSPGGYTRASPFSPEKRREMVDRHVGWEVYAAHTNGDTEFMKNLESSPNHEPICALLSQSPKEEVETLSSRDLATLGKLVREALVE